MARGLPARKIGMTQVFVGDHAVGATIVETRPCTVVRILTEEADGYDALQLGYDEVSESKVPRPIAGQFKKAGVPTHRRLFELRVDDPGEHTIGDSIGVEYFAEGEKVDVSGMSRGLGFQGVVKRWDFAGGPKSHGSHFHRRPGSVGQCVKPGRVTKGKKMPGQMGAKRVTVRGLQVLGIDAERNLLILRGATPGTRGSILEVGKR
jgi:large subunit ribosomal protein L3